MIYDVIVVGAGASGMISAIVAAEKASSVLIIEQKEKAGKKILATGNGKCNYTNMDQTLDCYRSDDSTFVKKVLSNFDNHKTLEFLIDLVFTLRIGMDIFIQILNKLLALFQYY